MKVRVFASDPGLNNYAISIVDVTEKKGRIEKVSVVKTGYLQNPIRNLSRVEQKRGRGKKKTVVAGLSSNYEHFNSEISRIIRKLKPDRAITERFQVRGRFMGQSCEFISYMNGILHTRCRDAEVDYLCVISSQWKNWTNKITKLEDLYTLAKVSGLAPHSVDTFCMAIYSVCHERDIQMDAFQLQKLVMSIKVKVARSKKR